MTTTSGALDEIVANSDTVVLCGHSMGGAIAAAVAARRPDLLRGLPTLLVTGTDDVIVDGDMRREITRINPQVHVAVIEGAGRSTRRDRSDEFHAIADPWIAERFAEARPESARV